MTLGTARRTTCSTCSNWVRLELCTQLLPWHPTHKETLQLGRRVLQGWGLGPASLRHHPCPRHQSLGHLGVPGAGVSMLLDLGPESKQSVTPAPSPTPKHWSLGHLDS